jgi:hypothetical protein
MALLRLRQKMFEHERVAPGLRLFGVANHQILIRISVDHEQGAEAVRVENHGHIPLGQPLAFEILANFGAFFINFTTAAKLAIRA